MLNRLDDGSVDRYWRIYWGEGGSSADSATDPDCTVLGSYYPDCDYPDCNYPERRGLDCTSLDYPESDYPDGGSWAHFGSK